MASTFVTIYQKDPDPATTYHVYESDIEAIRNLDVDLPPGTYKFEFYSLAADYSKFFATAPATGVDIDHATPVVITSSDQFLGTITFPVRAITLTVKDLNANPLAGKTVLEGSDPDVQSNPDADGTTNATGTVVFQNLPTTHALYFQGVDEDDPWDGIFAGYDDSPVISVQQGTSNANLNLTMAKRASLSGHVTGTGGVGLSMVKVTAYDVTTGGSFPQTAATDAQGNYTVNGLAAGDYRLEFADQLGEYTGEFYDNVPVNLSPTATPISVAANAVVSGKNAQLTAAPVAPPTGIDLKGVVKGAANVPLGGVEVSAYRNNVLKGQTSTFRDGRYTFTDLTSGSYVLRFDRASAPSGELPYVGQWYLNARSSASATPIAVTADSSPPDRNLTLAQYGLITGTITGNTGQPVESGYVNEFNLDGQIVNSADGSGSYQILAEPGSYYLYFDGYDSSTRTQYVPEWYDNATTMIGAKTVKVTSGGTTSGVNVRLTSQLESRSAPKISGSAVVGKTLTASTGTWNLSVGNAYKVTWLRGSTPVGTGLTHVVTAADVGSHLTAQVDAVHEQLTGQALSAPTAAVKRPSATSLTATSPSSKTVKFVVKITGTGLSNPGGKVTIKRGTTIVKSNVSVVNGVATFSVGSQPSGKRTYRAYYSGTTSVLASNSPYATVTVKS
ncbi:MAG: carboxypeptidase regulatory-like domain-containing protein [Marmoricola sp.]